MGAFCNLYDGNLYSGKGTSFGTMFFGFKV